MRAFQTWITATLALLLASCGNNKIDVSAIPQFRYYVESKFTSQIENTLVIEGSGVEQLSFKLSGRGFTADIPLDTEVPVKTRTKLQYVEVGDYVVNIQFFKSDGTPLLQDAVKWSFSLESPDNPIIGFASHATNDSRVVLLVSESRDPLTNEIWIEGDLSIEESPKGSWRTIPEFSKVPIHLTEDDGMKTIRVKLRNDFKNETDLKTIQIRKKSTAPTNCRVEVRGTGSQNRYFEVMVYAENDGPVFYRVFGDVSDPNVFHEFVNTGTRVPIKMTSGAGVKNLTVQIRDEAENYCLRQDIKVTSDPNYIGEGIRIKDDKAWSDSNQVTVLPWVDGFADDQVEMYVHGDILDDDNTFQWIAYKPELDVTLQPADGTRWVRVQYRINGAVTSFRYTSVYLKPYVLIQIGTDTPYKIVASEINQLSHLTLTGCAEPYNQVAFAASYKCAPNAPAATVVYTMKDGSSVTKATNFPP
ncbi:MAG TPA: hypothetical protein VE954_19240 [Oligoflexus sp.]|uniref:hypothetical protein n=1 Tax=Oligoflexus sp. TaxID=1971216 RepID=UPI002D4E7912|nr:hypothetical protein [Oligoflexus sp.]HYX35236.1 hypothetical protein [Oligoflexus sp.]